MCASQAGVTDHLIAALEAAQAKRAFSPIIALVQGRASAMADDLLPDGHAAYDAFVEATLRAHVWSVCEAVIGRKAPYTLYERDHLVAAGELLSAGLLHAVLDAGGISADRFSSADLIVTTDRPGEGDGDNDATEAKVSEVLLPALAAGRVACVSGYFGATPDGRIITLGRGGSDLAATLVAVAVRASAVVCWKVESTTDANNFTTAWSPGYVGVVHDMDTKTTIPHLTYDCANELAHYGKTALHPRSVFPVVPARIPVVVRNSLDRAAAGTTIALTQPSSAFGVTTVIPSPYTLLQYEVLFGAVGAPEFWTHRGLWLAHDAAGLVVLVGPDLATRALAPTRSACLRALEDAGVDAVLPDRVNGSPHSLAFVVPVADVKPVSRMFHSMLVVGVASEAPAARPPAEVRVARPPRRESPPLPKVEAKPPTVIA